MSSQSVAEFGFLCSKFFTFHIHLPLHQFGTVVTVIKLCGWQVNGSPGGT